LLPSPHGELAPAIEAVLDVYGTEIVVVVSHNGQGTHCQYMMYEVLSSRLEETPLDRELQSKELARIMSAAYPKPVIFLGYVVTLPHAERRTVLICVLLFNANISLAAPYKYMVEDGRVHDIDKDETDRWYVAN
jgi:hypothetical protein